MVRDGQGRVVMGRVELAGGGAGQLDEVKAQDDLRQDAALHYREPRLGALGLGCSARQKLSVRLFLQDPTRANSISKYGHSLEHFDITKSKKNLIESQRDYRFACPTASEEK
jgi:hypothetical protein